MVGRGHGHFGHPRVDGLGHRTDRILGLDEDVGAFTPDIAAVVVDQTAVGGLQSDPAAALVVAGRPGAGALRIHGHQIGLEHDVGVVAVGAQVDVAVACGHQVFDDVERGQRLQHDAGRLHVAFHDDGARNPPEGGGPQIADLLAAHIEAGGVTDVSAQRDQTVGGVGRAFALEGQALGAVVVVGHHLAAIAHPAQVEHDGVASAGAGLLQNDLVKAAAGLDDVDRTRVAGGRSAAHGDAVIVVAALVGDVDGPGREVGDVHRVGPLADDQAVDSGAGNPQLLAERVNRIDCSLAHGQGHPAGDTGEVQRGVAVAVGEGVVAVIRLEDVVVVAAAAPDLVVACAAPDLIITRAAVELVVAAVALEHVVAQPAGDHVVAVSAFEGVAIGHALGQGDLVIAAAPAQCAADAGQAVATDQVVVAGATVGVEHHATQARGVKDVVALAHVDHDLLDTGVALIPAIELDVDRAALARQDEGLVAVGGVEVAPLSGQGAGIDGQGVARLDGQHRLYLGCFVLEVEQVDLEQRRFVEGDADGADQRNPDRQLNEDVQREAGIHLDVEQVLEAATLVVVHGGDFAAADATVADPLDIGDIAGVVFGQHLACDVLQIDTGVEVDPAAAAASDRAQAHCQLQPDARADVELVFFLPPRARYDLAVSELRQGEVIDKKAVDRDQRVAGAQGLADPVGVKAKGQVGEGLEFGHGGELEQHGPDRYLGQWHPLVKLDAQQRQLVAEQYRIAAGEDGLPVVDALDVLEHLEARARGAARAAGGFGRHVVELGLQIQRQAGADGSRAEVARAKALE